MCMCMHVYVPHTNVCAYKQTYIHRGRQIYLCIYIYVHICLTSNVNHIKMMMIALTTIKARVVLTTMLIRSIVVLLMTAIQEELREQPQFLTNTI